MKIIAKKVVRKNDSKKRCQIFFEDLEIGMMVKMMDYVGYIVGKRNRAKVPSVEIRLISSYKNVDEDTMYYTPSDLILNDTYVLMEEN